MKNRTDARIGFVFTVLLVLQMATGCHLGYRSIQKQPPNGVAINDTLWFDRTEFTNIDWAEYAYWIGRVLPGLYHEILPDTHVWIRDYGYKPDSGYLATALREEYLLHPHYMFHPAVGITKEQAEQYSAWRSDRVFENYLISLGVVALNPMQDSIYYFSIDRFFRGEYKTLKPIDTFRHYPHYRLPTPEEYLAAAAYRDSVLEARQRWCFTKRCKSCLQFALNDTPVITEPLVRGRVMLPSPSRKRQCRRAHKKMILHVRGNVDELTSVPGVTTREVFQQNPETPDTLIHRDVNSYTGFRNVMTWRVWEP